MPETLLGVRGTSSQYYLKAIMGSQILFLLASASNHSY